MHYDVILPRNTAAGWRRGTSSAPSDWPTHAGASEDRTALETELECSKCRETMRFGQ